MAFSISPTFNPGRGSPITSVPRKIAPIKRPIQDLKPGKVIIPGDPGSQVNFSLMNKQLEDAKRGEASAVQLSKTLRAELKEANKQLENVNQRINSAVMAQNKVQADISPLATYSKLQRRTLKTVGLGEVSNRQSFGLAAITVALGITAILGRVD